MKVETDIIAGIAANLIGRADSNNVCHSLTYNFQYQSQFIDTDKENQRIYVPITDIFKK